MIDVKNIDFETLIHPHPMFKVLKPEHPATPEDPFYTKIAKLQKMLAKRYLWLSDEHRNELAIQAKIHLYFSGIVFNVFYEIGDFQGLIGFLNILPDFKCDMTFKIWDKKIWSKTLVRAGKELTELFMKELNLERISSETADERIVRMAKMIGFKVEGKKEKDFQFNNKLYTTYILGKYGE